MSMRVRTRMCTSLDGYISNAEGLPVQLNDPEWDQEAYGFIALQDECEAVLMGHTTFGPALDADRWPWEGLDVFVLASERPPDTPEGVTVESDPETLLKRVREANHGGDVHLVGGPTTIETYRALGAVDEFGLVLLPILAGEGMQLTPAIKNDERLALSGARELPRGAVELTYESP
jgi:dihydrofolate reductase